MARPAKSLDVLLDEINTIAPDRSKASDGWIGDTAHQAEASDHNPNTAGVVAARDYTHDPKRGADMRAISEYIRTHRPRVLKYLIFDRRIAGAWTGWKWTPYTGSNSHDKHMHVSVGQGADGSSRAPYDDTTPWGVREEFGMPSAKEIAEELATNKTFLAAVGKAVLSADLVPAVPPPHSNSDFETNPEWRLLYAVGDIAKRVRAIESVLNVPGGEPPASP